MPLGMGVGGTIDVWAGAVPRAPQWMIRANLEWLYRIVRLRRLRRSLPPLVRFALAVLRARAPRRLNPHADARPTRSGPGGSFVMPAFWKVIQIWHDLEYHVQEGKVCILVEVPGKVSRYTFGL